MLLEEFVCTCVAHVCGFDGDEDCLVGEPVIVDGNGDVVVALVCCGLWCNCAYM